MTDLVLYILWRRSEILRERYPHGFPRPWSADNVAMEDAVFHLNFYQSWGMLAVVVAAIGVLFSPWALIALSALPALSIHAFYRELITDGHAERYHDGTESIEELLDCRADLITRHAGLIIPSILAIVLVLTIWIIK